MKTKSILFFLGCAIITLSFTFSSVKVSESKAQKMAQSTETSLNEAPAGGLISEDK
jgi:hypothetical protein